MALAKQYVHIPLGVGVDTKTDVKQLQIGKLRTLKNSVLTTIGAIEKRFGTQKLGQYDANGNLITNGKTLATFKDELLLINNEALYAYAPQSDKWFIKDEVTGVSVESQAVLRNANEQASIDASFGGNYLCYAWEDSSGGVRASVFDKQSNQVIINDFLIDANGERPKVSYANQFHYVHYTNGS